MAMLLRGGRVFAPTELGRRDILVHFDRIAAVEPDLVPPAGVEVLRLDHLLVLPGLIDNHLHTLGGGGEGGPTSRPGRLEAADLVACGVTCAVACLGYDGTSRGLEDLYAHTLALREAGLGGYMLTGAFDVPPPTLTGSVRRDVFLIEPVIGVGEIAIADHRSSLPSPRELGRLLTEVVGGGRLVGKRGYLNLHVGEVPGGLRAVSELLGWSGLPADRLLPTHLNRTAAVLEEAVAFGQHGGYLDLTCTITPDDGYPRAVATVEAIAALREAGVAGDRIVISSDAGGGHAVRDGRGELIGYEQIRPHGLLRDFRRAAARFGLAAAAAYFSANAADALGLADRLGRIRAGLRADLLLLREDLSLEGVVLAGRLWRRDHESGHWRPAA